MPLTMEFKEVFKASIDRDPAFGHELLRGAVQCLLDDDLATGRAILRNYVNATIGFKQLAKAIELDAHAFTERKPLGFQPFSGNP